MVELIFLFILAVRASVEFSLDMFKLAGDALTAGALINLIILFCLFSLTRRQISDAPFILWCPFIFFSAISILWSPDYLTAVRVLLVLLTYAGAFTIPFLISPTASHRARPLKVILYSSVVPVLFGSYQLVTYSASSRLTSTFLHPNVFAFYLMAIIGLCLFLMSSSQVQFSRKYRPFVWGYATLLVTLVVMTQCRSAWAGTAVLFATYGVFVDRRALAALFLVPLLLWVPAVSDRIADLGRGGGGAYQLGPDGIDSYQWRQVMWRSALEDVSSHPLLGKGLASFGVNSPLFFPYADSSQDYGVKGVGAHSVFILTAYEGGVIGFLSYIWIYVAAFRFISSAYKVDRQGAIVIGAMVIAYALGSYSDNMLEYGAVNLYFWTGIGCIIAVWREAERQEKNFSNLAP